MDDYNHTKCNWLKEQQWFIVFRLLLSYYITSLRFSKDLKINEK